MGKKDKGKKKGGGAEKTQTKNDKKAVLKHKKMLEQIGEADIADLFAQLEADEKRRANVTETITPYPSPRSNFSLLAHPDKEELILFGGEFYNGKTLTVFNELFFYNIEKSQWKLVMAPGGPGPRCSHQMVAVANEGGQLWLFGGEHSTQSQMQFYHYKDLWVYQIAQKTWNKVTVSGGPSPRSGHRMVALKKKLYIFGGFYDSGLSYKYFNDVWCFSLETYKWTEIKPSGILKPLPRSAACMAATPEGKILIWGGYSKSPIKKDVDRGMTHSDMYALVPEANDSTGLQWKWVPIKPQGSRPPPRSGASVATAANGKAYVFGGVLDVDEDEEMLEGHFNNDLLLLDLSNQKYWPVEMKNKSVNNKKAEESLKEEPAQPLETTTDGVFTMSVGGSTNAASAKPTKLECNVPTKDLSAPSPRMKPGMAVCKGSLYLYGGQFEQGNKQCTLNDLYSLDLHKLDEWKTVIKQENNAHEWLESDSDDSDGSMSDDDDSDDSDDDSEMDTD